MLDNLKCRILENCNIAGTHYKFAVGFTFRLALNYRDELYVIPLAKNDPDGQISMRMGNGHIRLNVKESFKKDLGDADPDFKTVLEYYSKHGPVEKGVLCGRCSFS